MNPLLNNGAGLVISFIVVPGFIAIIAAFVGRGRLSAFTGRKVIHIGVANWWLIAMAMFDDPWAASAGPACSLLAALLVPRLGLVPGRQDSTRARDWGTILYSAALLLLVNLSWRGIIPPWKAGIGALILGWGDGCAALCGAKFGGKGLHIWGRRKTAAGTAAMFAVSFLACLAMTFAFNTRTHSILYAAALSAVTAAAATTLEMVTPFGMDNLSIPLGTALVYAGMTA